MGCQEEAKENDQIPLNVPKSRFSVAVGTFLPDQAVFQKVTKAIFLFCGCGSPSRAGLNQSRSSGIAKITPAAARAGLSPDPGGDGFP